MHVTFAERKLENGEPRGKEQNIEEVKEETTMLCQLKSLCLMVVGQVEGLPSSQQTVRLVSAWRGGQDLLYRIKEWRVSRDSKDLI